MAPLLISPLLLNKSVTFLLFLALFFTAGSHAQYFNADDFTDCNAAPLPQKGYFSEQIAVLGEIHLQGTFLVNFDSPDSLQFPARSDVAFRVEVAPHDVNVRLDLFNKDLPDPIASSNLGSVSNEMIFEVLPQGTYVLKMSYLGFTEESKYLNDHCSALRIEMAVVPLSRVSSLQQTVSCEEGNSLPPSDIFDPLQEKKSIHYNSVDMFSSYQLKLSSGKSNMVTNYRTYEFTVPEGVAASIEVSFEYDFLTSGSIFPLLLAPGVPVKAGCLKAKTCAYPIRREKNTVSVKALLLPGLYNLYVLSWKGFVNENVSNCAPLGMRVDAEVLDLDLNYVSCTAPRLPESFDSPGYFQGGFLYFQEDALFPNTSSIAFTIDTTSLIRVSVASEASSVKLYQSSSTEPLAWSQSVVNADKVIQISLNAGSYSLVIERDSSVFPTFCQTLSVMVAIAPSTSFPHDYCFQHSGNGVRSRSPDFGDMQPSLDADSSYFFTDPDPYFFNYEDDYSHRIIWSKTFYITEQLRLKALLGINFLLGDMDFYVVNTDSNSTSGRAEHQSTGLVLLGQLQPGNYKLVLATGFTGKSTSSVSSQLFPKCAAYDLSISLERSTDSCWQVPVLPEDLTVPAFLQTTDYVHFQDFFLLPRSLDDSLVEYRNVFFSPRVDSILRVFLGKSEYDLDLYLYQEGTQVASSLELAAHDETLVAVLHKHMTYRLKVVVFYLDFGNGGRIVSDEECPTFNMEFAIEPIDDEKDTSCHAGSELDPKEFFDHLQNGKAFLSDGDYHFLEESDLSTTVALPFTISSLSWIRAIVRYTFLWGDMELFLKDAETNVTLIEGANGYNYNDIKPFLLPPGKYVLLLIEPSRLPETQDWCIFFNLLVAIEPDVNTPQRAALSCPYRSLSSTFNGPGGLSEHTGNHLDIMTDVLLVSGESNPQPSQTVKFRVSETSLVRVFVPMQPYETKIYLKDAEGGVLYSTISKHHPLSYFERIEPGSYAIKLSVYGLPEYDCYAVPLQVSVRPLKDVTSQHHITNVCQALLPPSHVTFNKPIYTPLYYPRNSSQIFSRTLDFSLSESTNILLQVSYDFLTSGLTFRLDGTYISIDNHDVNTVTLQPQYSQNFVWMNHQLHRGNYTLSYFDPNNYLGDIYYQEHPITEIGCVRFQVYTNFNGTQTASDDCPEADILPTDLYSTEGGSTAYGGPQESDGTVRISGDNFLASLEHEVQYIFFQVPQDSFLRVFYQGSPSIDIDFVLFTNASDPNSAIKYALGSDEVESALWSISASANDYALALHLYEYQSQAETCPYYQFELALKTIDRVEDELLCPSTLPAPLTPTQTVEVDHQPYSQFSDQFYFTKDFIDDWFKGHENSKVFEYPISINLHQNCSFRALVEFDFLANDFRLVLKQAGSSVANSLFGLPESSDSYLNFKSEIIVESLPAGEYVLTIYQSQETSDLDLKDQFCHRFAFTLDIYPVNTSPTLLYITPEGGDHFDSTENLILTLEFSESVHHPWHADKDDFVILKEVNSKNIKQVVFPVLQEWYYHHTQFVASFPSSDLVAGRTYELKMKLQLFNNTQGETFVFDGEWPVYHFDEITDLECGNHGSLQKGECKCDEGYAGQECGDCASGYVPQNEICVPRVPCEHGTCNAHGSCSVVEGVATCSCDHSYSGEFCDRCADGFTDYPTCTFTNETNDESGRCNAELFPNTFNEPAFIGADGEMDLQGDFYLDLEHGYHDISFSITEDSLFRAYSERHEIDIDLWLYKLLGNNRQQTIAYGISINGEESLFEELSAGDYVLVLRYFVWDLSLDKTCQTGNVEVSLAPLSLVREEVDNYEHCPSHDTFPFSDHDTDDSFRIPSAGYTYEPSDVFGFTQDGETSFSFKFTIPYQKGKSAFLKAALQYRFLTGDIAMLVAAKDGSPFTSREGDSISGDYLKCDVDSENRVCLSGKNIVNGHILEVFLPHGEYELYIYLPSNLKDFIPCAPFQISFNVEFSEAQLDLFLERCELSAFLLHSLRPLILPPRLLQQPSLPPPSPLPFHQNIHQPPLLQLCFQALQHPHSLSLLLRLL